MRRRKPKSITPLFVLAIVFSAIGCATGLIIAPLLCFVLGLWLPGKIVFVVGSVFGFVGAVFWFVFKRIQELRNIASLLNSHRRIKVNRFAGQLGVTEFKAQMLISKCITKGLADGYFDRSSGEFFTKEAFLHQLSITDCPHCSAPATEIRLIGEQCQCDSCGRAIKYHWDKTSVPE